MSSSPTSNNNAAAQASERARLTEAEKKQNHILSEQKRRLAIRAGFDRLASIVPGMEGQGRSEAVVLDATVREIVKELKRKEKLEQRSVGSGQMTQEESDAAYGAGRLKAQEAAEDGSSTVRSKKSSVNDEN